MQFSCNGRLLFFTDISGFGKIKLPHLRKGEFRMKMSEKVRAVLDSGVPPIVFDMEPVRFFESDRLIFRSLMVINSLELGTLTYRQYRFVARRTKQGERMVERHLHKLLRAIPELLSEYGGVDCFTVPVYARLLKDGYLARLLLDSFTLFPKVPPELICVELSADILYENVEDARERIDELRSLGVRVAIAEVGDEFCPVFRLSELEFDYAFLDNFATASLERADAERVCGSLVKYVHYLNIPVIAPELDSETAIETARQVGCDGYTSESFTFPNMYEEVSAN